MAGGAGLLGVGALGGALRPLLPTLAPVALPLPFVLGATAAAPPLLRQLDLCEREHRLKARGPGERLPDLSPLTWIRACSLSVGGGEAACKTLWMRKVWSRDTSSRSPSSSSSSRRVLVAAASSTTWPLSEGSRESSEPTPEERGAGGGSASARAEAPTLIELFKNSPGTFNFLLMPFSQPACRQRSNI